jgi:hypothetical protein
MKAFHLRYNKSLTIEKTNMIDFNQHSELVTPRFDFGYSKQVHQYRQMG